ncbi:MAG: YfhO family protein [Candidatus Omnitrophota bacterium]
MYSFKVVFYLIAILIISLLPVYLFRRKWGEVFMLCGVIIYFFVLCKNLIWGNLAVYHDTRQVENLLMILKQWLDAGIPLGWNPYMNAGEPFCLFSNIFLWAPWVFFCWINKVVALNPYVLFNLFWIYIFVSFCIGSFLLFLALYDNFKAALFCFISLMFSGMFFMNLGQPAGLFLMYLLPYILFSIVLSFKKRNINGILFSILFLSIAYNQYLPPYITIIVGVFVFFLTLFDCRLLLLSLRLFFLRYRLVLLVLTVSLLLLSPAIFSYIEMQDYVSPTRGGVGVQEGIKCNNTGSQPCVNAPLWGYRIFFDRAISYALNVHHAFYFGIIPLFLVPIALLRVKDKPVWPIFFTSVIVLFLGCGTSFCGYRFLIKHIPTFNLMRHSFVYAQVFSFFLICLAGYGIKELLRKELSKKVSLAAIILVIIVFLIGLRVSSTTDIVRFGIPGGSFLILLIIGKHFTSGKRRRGVENVLYTALILLIFINMTVFYNNQSTNNFYKKPLPISYDMKYPLTRTLFPSNQHFLPPDISSLAYKKAALTHPNENFTFFRYKKLNDMFKFFVPESGYERALGVNDSIIYFTAQEKILPENILKEDFIKVIYEDSGGNVLLKDRNVFFLEKDIDFNAKESAKSIKAAEIKYTKRDNPNGLELLIKAPQDGYLVRLENFHRGWQAYVDGQRVTVYRANYAFQAIRMPEGEHKVVFKFVSLYTFLMYIHCVCMFLCWVAFNLYLFKIKDNSLCFEK